MTTDSPPPSDTPPSATTKTAEPEASILTSAAAEPSEESVEADEGPRVELPDAAELESLGMVERATVLPDTFQPLPAILWSLGLGTVGAILWAFITYVTNYELGLIAILLGILAGMGAAKGGRTPQSQLVGAVCASVCYFLAQIMLVFVTINDVAYDVTLALLSAIIGAIVKETFSSMGVLFLGIAIYEGYRIPRAQ